MITYPLEGCKGIGYMFAEVERGSEGRGGNIV